MTILLAADIGGTKSELALFDLSRGSGRAALRHARYQNREFADFSAVLTEFLAESPPPQYGCFGVAAVIRRGTARLTNRDWRLDGQQLAERFGLRSITLINDLTALCSSLPLLKNSDLLTIREGQVEQDGIRAVIAPGTGLGEGFLLERDGCFFPQGSEGGHCDFAPLNREQTALLSALRTRFNTVSYEMLCSGTGLPNIYDFLAETGLSGDQVRTEMIAATADRTPLIVEGAHNAVPCPLCAKTIALFLEILGSEAGNLALKSYATGGLFIGGGILPRIAEKVSFSPFLKAFSQKEKMGELMEAIPVHLILKRDAALLGATHYGRHLYT